MQDQFHFLNTLTLLDDSIYKPPELEERAQKIQHFSHNHALSFYFIERIRVLCTGCGLQVLGPAYGCIKCRFLLHESCSQMHQEIMHDFHRLHPLIAQKPISREDFSCSACQQKLSGISFGCDKCNFYLDIVCTSLTPTLKHKRHPHKLIYFTLQISLTNPFLCDICGMNCQVPFYRCVECNFNLHVRCALPEIVKHDCHIHPLTFRDKVVEDDSGEHYCDVCETERNGDHAVYYCEECTVVAHIECIITEEITSPGNVQLDSKYLTAQEEQKKEDEVSDGRNPALDELDKVAPQFFKEMVPSVSKMEIKHFSHEHILKLREMIIEDSQCYGCLLNISGPAYMCEICPLFLHKSCAEFPQEMQHPFHSLHTLTLLPQPPPDEDGDEYWFLCDECRTFFRGFRFNCNECDFNLDMKCAALIHHPPEYEDKKTQKVRHFSDNHALSFYNIMSEEIGFVCGGCSLPILGPAYGCGKCSMLIHQSCSQMPKEIRHDFHPLHSLIGEDLGRNSYLTCNACQQRLSDMIHYGCEDCEFYLHFECTSLTPTFKHQRHEHKLTYFTPKLDRVKYFWCNVCGRDCDVPFYRCVPCNFNLHVKCCPLPNVVKHKCHIHPLTLMDKYIEEGWDEYCCDVCETERNGDHGVYYCEECSFAAHIDCVITDMGSPKKVIFNEKISKALNRWLRRILWRRGRHEQEIRSQEQNEIMVNLKTLEEDVISNTSEC